MTNHGVGAVALCAVLAACGTDKTSAAPPADAPEVAIDAPPDTGRTMLCGTEGTSTVTGVGPDGALDASHVYGLVLTGFCQDQLDLIVTTEGSLSTPYLDRSVDIRAALGTTFSDGTGDWSGTFAATIARPDGTSAAAGTVQVDHASRYSEPPGHLRATARFTDQDWQFSATIDARYCLIEVCD